MRKSTTKKSVLPIAPTPKRITLNTSELSMIKGVLSNMETLKQNFDRDIATQNAKITGALELIFVQRELKGNWNLLSDLRLEEVLAPADTPKE